MTSIDRLKTLLDAYGADPDRWPEAERAAARDLLAGSTEARAYARDAEMVDALLAHAALRPMTAIDPAALTARIVGTPQRPAHRPAATGSRSRAAGPASWFAFGWPNLAALAAAGVVGFLVGWSDLGTTTATNRDVLDLMTPTTVLEEPLW